MKIVSIGGGENGRPGTEYEIKVFDEEIVSLTGKQNPNYLFIGYAQSKPEKQEGYFSVMKNNFSLLGCQCRKLEEKDLKDEKVLKEKIAWADIIYVGGGNTLRLMTLLRKYNAVELIKAAGEKGCVLCGVSAGAICWCNYGNSDSRLFTSGSDKLIRVTAMGFIDALFCPHYDNASRQNDLVRMMKTTKGVALCFENCTALKVVDNRYEVLKAKQDKKAYKSFYKNGKYVIQELNSCGSVDELVSK